MCDYDYDYDCDYCCVLFAFLLLGDCYYLGESGWTVVFTLEAFL